MHDLSECLGADIVWIEGATDPLQPLGVLLVAWISDRIEELAVSPGLLRDSKVAARIASPEMLPSVGLLPHVICSPPVFGGGGHEADQHGDTGRVDSGGGGAVCPVHSKGSGAHSGRVWGVDGPASQACDASASRRDAR